MTLNKGIHERIKPGRVIEGCSAVLLPFSPEGVIDEAGFQRLLAATLLADLIPAVNMDTGYVNLLEPAERRRILALTPDVKALKK